MDELEILRRRQKAERERARAKDKNKKNNGAPTFSPIQHNRSRLDDSPEDREKRLKRLRREERIRNGQRLMEKHGYISKRRRSEEQESNAVASSPPKKRSSLERTSTVTSEADNHKSPLMQCPSSVSNDSALAAQQILQSNEQSTTRVQHTTTPTPKKAAESAYDGYSSSDIDDETIFQMAKSWRGESVEGTQKKQMKPSSPTKTTCQHSTKSESLSVSSKQVNILETQFNDNEDKRIRSSKQSERISTQITNDSEGEGSSHQQRKNRTRCDDETSSHSEDDLYSYAKRFNKKQSENYSESSDDSCARYLRKNKRNSSNSPLKNSVSTKVRGGRELVHQTKMKRIQANKTGDDLWDDSSDDEKSLEQEQPKKRGKRKRKGRVASDECASEDYKYDILEADEELKTQLKPDFHNPKMGKPSALVQYILERNHVNGQEEVLYDYVAASINRYLQEYQQKAISWMHNSVTMRKGCILGDDMGEN